MTNLSGLSETVQKLAENMDKGFGKLEGMMMERFDGIGQEFVKVYDRFNKVDDRFDKIDDRFDKVEATMEHNRLELSGRLTSVERRTSALEER